MALVWNGCFDLMDLFDSLWMLGIVAFNRKKFLIFGPAGSGGEQASEDPGQSGIPRQSTIRSLLPPRVAFSEPKLCIRNMHSFCRKCKKK